MIIVGLNRLPVKTLTVSAIKTADTMMIGEIIPGQPVSLFVLVSVFPQLFFAFMGGNFPQFTFSSAGHLASPWYQNGNSMQQSAKKVK
jgi:hypothetical protein